MTDEDVLQLADRLFTAIEAGDLAAVDACYTEDVVVWGNYDGRERDKAASMRLLGWLCDRLTGRRYEVRRRIVIPGGFLQEHVLCGLAPDGTAVAMPACIVAEVADGRITRMNEYLDPAGIAALSR
ncbi:MAG TPA: nuclear transport factor 2 family protein [Acidimicrobiales bacterium]|nr:nuclear transport factor 2 family protein [Acidimicrobiales bacterium]